MINKNKKIAFTLAELMIVLVILPVLVVAGMNALHPKTIKEDAMLKAGKVFHNQLAIATTDIEKNYSKTGYLSQIYKVDKSAVFNLTDNGATDNLLALYKSILKLSRGSSTLAKQTINGVQYSNNFKLRNGATFALALYNNCTTTTTTYNPMYTNPENPLEVTAMYEYDTCGTIFYDINDADPPNTLGKDQFVAAIDKDGLR